MYFIKDYKSKLNSLRTSFIIPFTFDNIQEAVKKGIYSFQDMYGGIDGWVRFITDLITVKDKKGNVVERSYVCTSKNSGNYYRYIGDDEEDKLIWEYDSGGLWLHTAMDAAKDIVHAYIIRGITILNEKLDKEAPQTAELSFLLLQII